MSGDGAGRAEDLRKAIHVATGALALLLRWLPPAGAAALGLALVAHNVLVMPRWGRRLHRGRVDPGILTYPVAVLGLMLLFRNRLELAAAAWGLLAFGDGAASLAGRHLGGPRLPWNPAKRLTGTIAFVVIGAPAAAALLAIVSGGSSGSPVTFGQALPAVIGAAVVAAAAESIRSAVDDNLRVAAAAAAVLALAFGLVPVPVSDGLPAAAARAGLVLLPAAVLGAVAVALRAATPGGALAGMGLLVTVTAAGGWGPGAALAAFVIAGSAATRVGRARKRGLGLEEPGGGRRGAAHALANGGVAAGLALAALLAGRPAWSLGAVAAAATAAFDTVATEIGPLVQRRPFCLATLRRVPAGTPGGVSLAGTLAGLAAASGVAAAGLWGAGRSGSGILPSGAGALVACVAAAALAATLESLLSGAEAPLGHHARNVLNTAAGAGLALALVEA